MKGILGGNLNDLDHSIYNKDGGKCLEEVVGVVDAQFESWSCTLSLGAVNFESKIERDLGLSRTRRWVWFFMLLTCSGLLFG